MSKASYVRQAPARLPGREDHTCHWPGCTRIVKPALWGCTPHWFALPAALRAAIWRAYRPGQEADMRPSDEYLRVAQSVQDWIRERERERAETARAADNKTIDLF